MTRLTMDISMSLDGYVAGPNPGLEKPLGEGGERLHEWAFAEKRFQEQHGLPGGERGDNDEIIKEWAEKAGAIVMGRRMYSGGSGRWEDDPNAGGWWGDDPPFDVPVFVLTHHARETELKQGTSIAFVTGGIEDAFEQARAVAGDRPVGLGGGANVAQQYLEAGLLDELQIHLVPVLLGDGVRLFEGAAPSALRIDRVIAAPNVTHLRYRTGGE